MSYQIQNTAQAGGTKLDILNYGLPDTGKTLAIARLQALGFRPLVLACDPGGLTTLNSFNVDFIEIPRIKVLGQWLADAYQGRFNVSQYDMICVDGASNLSYMCLKETGEDSKDRRLDYGLANITFRRCIDDIRRLPNHIYMNAFEGEIKNAPEGAKFGAIVEGNKFSIQFTGLFNCVFRSFRYMDNNGNSDIAIQTQFDGTYLARERKRICNQYEPSIDVAVRKILNIQ